MESETEALIKVWSIISASLCYCYFIVSKIPHGKFRLFSVLPIICLYTILPLSLSTIFPTGITAFFITWLTSFKLLLFSFNLGPLTTPCIIDSVNNTSETRGDPDVRNLTNKREPIRSFSRFVLIAAFPVKGNDPSAQNNNRINVLPLKFWSKSLISAILIAMCDRYKGELHPGVTFVIYCCLLYLLIDIIIGVANIMVGPMMGLELVRPSDEPYLSTSLQDFWGRRWNLMVTDTLRHTIHKPIRVFSSKYIGKEWAVGLGIMASFLVSGLVHELIFYYFTRVSPSWEVTWFFVLHGLCVIVEVALKKILGQKLRIHRAVTGPLTVGFAMGTGYLWFFPPLVRNHVDLRAIVELKTLYEFVKGMLKWYS